VILTRKETCRMIVPRRINSLLFEWLCN
jgi:hypothetical protein